MNAKQLQAAWFGKTASNNEYAKGWKGRPNEYYLVHGEETGYDYDRLIDYYGPFPDRKSMEEFARGMFRKRVWFQDYEDHDMEFDDGVVKKIPRNPSDPSRYGWSER